jgi:hypothetical protein
MGQPSPWADLMLHIVDRVWITQSLSAKPLNQRANDSLHGAKIPELGVGQRHQGRPVRRCQATLREGLDLAFSAVPGATKGL